MSRYLSKRQLVINAMFVSTVLIFTAQVFMIGVSVSSRSSFSGVVYAEPGVPVYGAMISASGPQGDGYAITNPSGQYSINEGLGTGTYNVTAVAIGYLQAKVENVQVTVGQTTPNVNFDLQRSGGISGKVTDTISGQPLKDVMVMAIPIGGGTFGWVASTDADGNYLLATNLVNGNYNVSVPLPENHVSKMVGPISVTVGVEVKNVNVPLERSGIISGRVTAAPGGQPLVGASVIASSSTYGYFGSAQTNATGYYRITTGLGTGTYTVMAWYNTSYSNPAGASVAAGVETPNVDFTITVSPPSPSGIIMGRVTDTDSKPIYNAHVTADGQTTLGYGDAYTDANGNYVISSGLQTDTYTVSASAKGFSTGSISGVSVTVSQVTTDVNLQLSRIPPAQSGTISGAVQGEANPIPELQYPIAILLLTTLAAVILAKSLKIKTEKRQ